MPALRKLWVTLRTQNWKEGGTNALFFLEFSPSGKSFKLPNQPGDDLAVSASTTYVFNVDNLSTEDFVSRKVTLRNDNTGREPAKWRCKSVLIIGVGEDGKYYPLVAMSDVERWLAADEPEGLTLILDILKQNEIGVIGT